VFDVDDVVEEVEVVSDAVVRVAEEVVVVCDSQL
jgi:hypothetical protein